MSQENEEKQRKPTVGSDEPSASALTSVGTSNVFPSTPGRTGVANSTDGVLLLPRTHQRETMNPNMLVRRLMQRPFVCLLIVILAALGGYAGWVGAKGGAESRSAVVVVPPWSFIDEYFKNPMLNLTDRATALATALVVAIQRGDVQGAVVNAGATSYDASNLSTDARDPTRSAVIFLTVTGPNKEAAHAGALSVIDGTRGVLKGMQEDAGTGDLPSWRSCR